MLGMKDAPETDVKQLAAKEKRRKSEKFQFETKDFGEKGEQRETQEWGHNPS